MKKTKKELIEIPEEGTEIESNDLLDFIDLINCVVNYYAITSTPEDFDPADSWKQKAGLVKKSVPEEVDDLVKQAFMKKLKKHI